MKKIILSLSLLFMISNLTFAQEKKAAATLAANIEFEATAEPREQSIGADLNDTKEMAYKFVKTLGLTEKYMNPFMTIISLKKQKYSGTNYSYEKKKMLMSEFEKNVKTVVDERVIEQIKSNQEINDYLFGIKSEK